MAWIPGAVVSRDLHSRAMKFRRSQLDAEVERFTRSDVSFISEVVSFIAASRADGLPVEPDELPNTNE